MISECLEYCTSTCIYILCIYLRSTSQGMPHQTHASTVPTSRYQKILSQFEPILSIYNLLFTQIPHEDEPQRAETCRSYSALSVTTLKHNIVHLLLFSQIFILFISIYVFLLTLLIPSLRFLNFLIFRPNFV
jgi:hypothetical protein